MTAKESDEKIVTRAMSGSLVGDLLLSNEGDGVEKQISVS
jgi:hypothetical protein